MNVDLIISSKKLFRVPLEDTDIYQIILELNYENIIVWTWEQRNYSSNSYNLSVFNIFFDTGLYVEIHYCNKEYEHIWKKMLADNMIKLMGHVLNNDLYHVVRYVFLPSCRLLFLLRLHVTRYENAIATHISDRVEHKWCILLVTSITAVLLYLK